LFVFFFFLFLFNFLRRGGLANHSQEQLTTSGENLHPHPQPKKTKKNPLNPLRKKLKKVPKPLVLEVG